MKGKGWVYPCLNAGYPVMEAFRPEPVENRSRGSILNIVKETQTKSDLEVEAGAQGKTPTMVDPGKGKSKAQKTKKAASRMLFVPF